MKVSSSHKAYGSIDLGKSSKKVSFGKPYDQLKSMNKIMQNQLTDTDETTFRANPGTFITQTSSMTSDLLQKQQLKSMIKKNPGNPKLQKLARTEREQPSIFKKSMQIMEPISSGDSDFGRDDELVVDNHIIRSPPPRKSIYERALATNKERDNSQPIVWPSGSKTIGSYSHSGNILFGDSLKYSKTQKNNNINFNAVDFLL